MSNVKAPSIIVRVLYFVAMVVMASSLYGQECTLSMRGQVLDAHDKVPLEYSSIYILETGNGVAADSAGMFYIGNLCPGTYTLRYSHIGCDPRTRKVRLSQDLEITLVLEHHAELLETIHVASRAFGQSVSQSKASIGVEEVARFSGQTLGEALESVSGVSALQTGPTVYKPIIRGLHSNRIILFNNGLRQTGQEWGSDHAPEIDLQALDKVVVMKGAGTMEYGVDAIGGVIVTEKDRLPYGGESSGKAHMVGMTNGGLVGAGMEYAFPFGVNKHFAGELQASFRKAGDFRSPAYSLTNTGLEELNASAAFGFEHGLDGVQVYLSTFNTELGVLRSAHIGNLTDFEQAIESDRPLVTDDFSYEINSPRQKVHHHLGKVEGKKWFSWGMIKVLYGVQYNQREEFDIRRGDRDQIPAMSLGLFSQQAEVSFHHHPEGEGPHGTVGLVLNHRDNTNNPETGIRPLIPDYAFLAPGLFVTERLEKERYTVEAGLRYDYQRLQVLRFNLANQLERPLFHFNQFSGTFGGAYEVSSKLSVSGNVSTAHRAPGVHELFSEGLHHGAATIEEGDPDLSPERSFELQASLSWKPVSALDIVVEYYWKRINDFIYLQPLPEPRLTIRGAFPVFQYSQTNARMTGIDASIRWQITPYIESVTQVSFIRAKDLDARVPLIFIPPDQLMQKFRYVSVPTKRGLRFDGSVTLQWVRQQDRFPEGVDLAPPPDGYFLAELGAGLQFPVGLQEGRASILVSNAFNARYRSYLNRLRYFADEVGRNIQFRIQYLFTQKHKN